MRKHKIIALVSVVLGSMLTVSSVQAYNYPGYRWGGAFPYVPVDLSGIYVNAWRDSLAGAMGDWNGTGAKFILYSASSENDVVAAYQVSDALAWATTSRKYGLWGDITRATMSINTYHTFRPGSSSWPWYDLRTVGRHEFGHWLRLDHASSPAAVMYYQISAGQVKNISSDDAAGIRAIYGVR